MTLLGSQHSILIRSKFRSVLQFRLQQRRTRETQGEEGSMPLNHGKFPKQEDSYAFEEDSSSGSLSPEQQLSEPESQSSACASTEGSALANALASPIQTGAREHSEQGLDDGLSSQTTPPIPVPAIVKSKSSDKNRHKKPKDVKPKVKKLKYHQYIPPDQKGEKSPPPMDSAYARLLQQQQLFLQLQILSQQKHAHHQHSQHSPAQSGQGSQGPARQPAFSYQPHPSTHSHKGPSEQLSCNPSGPTSSVHNSSSPVKNSFPNQSSISPVKPGPLPANLDDLKVSELRQHLRMRGLPVSGTKTALIERLRPFADPCCGSPPSDITTVTFPVTPSGSLTSSSMSQGFYPYPSVSSSSSPPVSPASSELSLSGSLPDSFSDMPLSPPTHLTLQPSPGSLEEGLGVGLEAEKDKMLVEKQKVIDELTWKLHQEQRQVEELKMQLHKRKRCYGPSQEPGPPQPPLPQHSPSLMGQHFFGVTVKQEPLSSSCPLSSPKQLKSPGVAHLEEMGLGSAGPVGSQLMDGAPHSGSPSNMSAFLSPQCSPQDSPAAKTSSSPQPPSPHAPYLLTPPLGRDDCGHPLGGTRLCPMQMQQKSGGQLMNCPYPSEHRAVQAVYPSDCGINHGASVKSEHMPKQMNRSQQMDELLDVLIENGGCPGLLVPRFHRHYEHPPPAQLPYDHSANHLPESHLETLLSAPIGRGAEGEAEAYGGHPRPAHHVSDKLLLSGPELQGVAFSMAFTDANWDSMEWLDLTPPTSANTCSAVPPPAPGIFTSEFLDVTDMNLSSAMDLHLDHW